NRDGFQPPFRRDVMIDSLCGARYPATGDPEPESGDFMTVSAASENPLLATSGLPPFDRIAPEHVVPAVRQLLSEAESEVSALESGVRPTWAGLIEPLDEIGRRFEYTWGPVS